MSRRWRTRGVALSFDGYKKGDSWYACDRCGERHRRSGMLTEWTGLKVDASCLDPRPPQMTPPNVYPEGVPFIDARPPQDNGDVLQDDTSIFAQAGLAWQGAAGTAANPWQVTNTQASQPGVLNTQGVGAISPRPVLENPLPTPGASVNEDDVVIRTGPVTPPSVTTTFGDG